MTAPRTLLAIAATTAVIHAAAASAAAIDMDDPRRALGREGDVRVDAQIIQEIVSPGSPIGVTYQVENLSAAPVGIAHRIATASYDSDTQTITFSIGAEVPEDGRMPHMVMIAPGEKKVLTAGATPALTAAIVRTGGAPRLVQIKVSILRDTEPFAALIGRQDPRNGIVLTDEQFEKWFESNDTIFLNSVPVRYSPRGGATRANHVGADRRSSGSASF